MRYGQQNGVRSVVRRWSRHPRCVGLARQELREALAAWGLGALEDSALLVLSELLTNAARHAPASQGRDIETHYVPRPDGLCIEVHDMSPDRPRRRPPTLDDCDGRGLILVATLADTWGVSEQRGPGKVVWAQLSLPPRADGEHGF
jgi:serine/threonine-protein kinase RsbW